MSRAMPPPCFWRRLSFSTFKTLCLHSRAHHPQSSDDSTTWKWVVAGCRSIDPLILFVVLLAGRVFCCRHGLGDGLSDVLVV